MKTIIKLLLTAFAVVILSKILSGVTVDSNMSAISIAIVLGILQATLQPIFQFLALPVTIVTFGLFSLVVNASIIMLADFFVGGFAIASFWWAVWFGILLSLFQSILYSFINKK